MYQDKVKEIVEQIFNHTNCTITKCEVVVEGGMFWCLIETPDSSFMIGRDGETLRSLNHIVQKIIEKSFPPQKENDVSLLEKSPSIFIDINGYLIDTNCSI